MSNYANKCYNSLYKAQKLLIFVHGYNGSITDVEYALDLLLPRLEGFVTVVPQAVEKCEKNADKYQWFSLWKSDPDDKRRKAETPLPEILSIYEKFGEDISLAAQKMNEFIDEQQQKFAINDENTFICGVSQGAMLALYTALSRKNAIAGCVMFAGVVCGAPRLEKELKSRPEVLQLHGKDDVTVSYQTLAFSQNWLKAHGIVTQAKSFDGLAHRMNEAEMVEAAAFLNRNKL